MIHFFLESSTFSLALAKASRPTCAIFDLNSAIDPDFGNTPKLSHSWRESS